MKKLYRKRAKKFKQIISAVLAVSCVMTAVGSVATILNEHPTYLIARRVEKQ